MTAPRRRAALLALATAAAALCCLPLSRGADTNAGGAHASRAGPVTHFVQRAGTRFVVASAALPGAPAAAAADATSCSPFNFVGGAWLGRMGWDHDVAKPDGWLQNGFLGSFTCSIDPTRAQ